MPYLYFLFFGHIQKVFFLLLTDEEAHSLSAVHMNVCPFIIIFFLKPVQLVNNLLFNTYLIVAFKFCDIFLSFLFTCCFFFFFSYS